MAKGPADTQEGIVVDPLFVGPTRPSTIWGVTYPAWLINVMVTMEIFVFTQNLLWLLLFIPIHLIFWLISLKDPRIFELLGLWGPTKGFALLGNFRVWRAATYTPLALKKRVRSRSRKQFRKLQKQWGVL